MLPMTAAPSAAPKGRGAVLAAGAAPALLGRAGALNPSGGRGRGMRGWTLRNGVSTPSRAAMTARVGAEPPPQLGAWMMLNTRMPIPALDRSTPRQSTGAAPGSLEDGTTDAMSAATTPATG